MKRILVFVALWGLLACEDSSHKQDSRHGASSVVLSEEFVLSLDGKPLTEVVSMLAVSGSFAKVSDIEEVLTQLDEKYEFRCDRFCHVERK